MIIYYPIEKDTISNYFMELKLFDTHHLQKEKRIKFDTFFELMDFIEESLQDKISFEFSIFEDIQKEISAYLLGAEKYSEYHNLCNYIDKIKWLQNRNMTMYYELQINDEIEDIRKSGKLGWHLSSINASHKTFVKEFSKLQLNERGII